MTEIRSDRKPVKIYFPYNDTASRQGRQRSKNSGQRYERLTLTHNPTAILSDILAPTFFFGTREWDFVGYPTESGVSGSILESNMVFAVMSWAEEEEKADRAWELIRSVVTEKDGYAHSRHGFGILLSQLKADLAASSRYDYYYYAIPLSISLVPSKKSA